MPVGVTLREKKTAVDEDEQDQATVVLRRQDPLADVFGMMRRHGVRCMLASGVKATTGMGISTVHSELVIPPRAQRAES